MYCNMQSRRLRRKHLIKMQTKASKYFTKLVFNPKDYNLILNKYIEKNQFNNVQNVYFYHI